MNARKLLALGLACLWPCAGFAQDAPRIFLDQPERIVEYQLNRLSSDVLVKVERRDTDPRYRPVYVALLTREGVPRAVREEAVAALVRLGAPSASHALMDAMGRVAPEASAVAETLMSLATAQTPEALGRERALFQAAVDETGDASFRTSLGYAALAAIEPDPSRLWQLAASRPDHLRALLVAASSLPAGPSGEAARRSLAGLIDRELQGTALEVTTRAAGLMALVSVRPDRATADVIVAGLGHGDAAVSAGAARALVRLPGPTWARMDAEPALAAIIANMKARSPNERATPEALDLLALAGRLVGQLPPARASLLRAGLAAVGAQVVRITALPEQVSFDVRWFAVEAGRAVQIVLVNPDAMPHNVVIGRPGSLQEIGTAAGVMSMPSDASIKPFVPDLPSVLFATQLLQQGGVERLGFLAPAQPGAYVFACTFPGHWVRMYGVMLVVPNLVDFEAAPEPPTDPMTGKAFESRNLGI